MKAFTFTIYLQPNQEEFVRSLIQPNQWDEHWERVLSSLTIAQLNLLMYRKLDETGPTSAPGLETARPTRGENPLLLDLPNDPLRGILVHLRNTR